MEAEGAIRMLPMTGGTGEDSYANNSSLQHKAITIAKPLIEEAIKDVYSRLLPKTLCISDMGCSSGPNTFYAVSIVIEAVVGLCFNLSGGGSGRDSPPPEFFVHLNDLPTNDFNTVFTSLPRLFQGLKENLASSGAGVGVGSCFLTGVPGSFYERVFPSQSLHFVHSSYSLQLLSQAPEGAEGNKGNIYLSSSSPSKVVEAYQTQFTKDFSSFLRFRAVEIIDGGCMVITLVGRKLEDLGAWESQGHIMGPLSKTINDMVDAGYIEEEKVDSFNFPVYYPSIEELKALVDAEGSFTISGVGLNDVHIVDDKEISSPDVLKKVGQKLAKIFRAVIEPLLASHFGEHVMNELFSRYAEKLSDSLFMSKGMTKVHNITLSLRKKD